MKHYNEYLWHIKIYFQISNVFWDETMQAKDLGI
jgi:hypothetical protein